MWVRYAWLVRKPTMTHDTDFARTNMGTAGSGNRRMYGARPNGSDMIDRWRRGVPRSLQVRECEGWWTVSPLDVVPRGVGAVCPRLSGCPFNCSSHP